MRLKKIVKKSKTDSSACTIKNASLLMLFLITSLVFCIFGPISKTLVLLYPTETDQKYDKMIQPTTSDSRDKRNANCTIEIPSPVATVAYVVSITSCPRHMAEKVSLILLGYYFYHRQKIKEKLTQKGKKKRHTTWGSF